ncbi:MAG: hypothetical protein ABSE47_09750 [Acidimicrobiales bacterium]|jgi:hypothetical protein
MKSGWWSRRAITLHVCLMVAVPLFITLGLWQLSRALHGNVLSWAYTFEWPFFAAYVTWMWWKLVHEEMAEHTASPAGETGASHEQADSSAAPPDAVAPAPAPAAAAAGPPLDWDPYDEADPELAAYNRYLASLHAGQRKR